MSDSRSTDISSCCLPLCADRRQRPALCHVQRHWPRVTATDRLSPPMLGRESSDRKQLRVMDDDVSCVESEVYIVDCACACCLLNLMSVDCLTLLFA